MTTPAEKRARFRELHESGCFVIPNPWDAGSGRILQALGFQALASTSSGFAWSTGRLDNEVPLNDMLDHLAVLSAATDLPLNADFENGYADAPEDVAANVRRALATGVAGLSIEDMSHDPGKPLYETALAVERVRAARAAIDADGTGAVLVARAEGLLIGQMDLGQTLNRLTALAEAGADCLYAPGLKTREEIGAAVKAVAPLPLNVLMWTKGLTVAELADLGVRRISVGGALARAAWAGFLGAAREIATEGRFDRLGEAATGAELKALLAP
ncbi:MAG: isocitrate lyase/phosphoenolpyruvate mutase family protein [Phenylobacterium sp.]|uniref:isocitrate lyase/PEP mutase family protein n=1 Tax=Phenylobacterium sp. TaxID=1871053 RepID=UPI001200B998|nr:isocitrate lyase/phosphoenolpyruvate mutase family protein [Phenylobacterium sp.]TAJ73414.1 MAG: isocitrate lyase/phosphoenolpyruvate mutase family protein [Phenylobacterium sp.]